MITRHNTSVSSLTANGIDRFKKKIEDNFGKPRKKNKMDSEEFMKTYIEEDIDGLVAKYTESSIDVKAIARALYIKASELIDSNVLNLAIEYLGDNGACEYSEGEESLCRDPTCGYCKLARSVEKWLK